MSTAALRPPTRSRVRRALTVAAAAAGVLLLSSCVRYTTDLTVDADLLIDGSLTLTVERSSIEQMGGDPADLDSEIPTDLPDGVQIGRAHV